MRISVKILALAILGTMLASCNPQQEPDLVPQPQNVTLNGGTFTIDNNVSILGNADFEIEYLKDKLSKGASVSLQEGNGGKRVIEIKIDPESSIENEGYRLSVLPDTGNHTTNQIVFIIRKFI